MGRLVACCAALLSLVACGEQDAIGKPRVAYVTNGTDPFWTIAAAGARAAAAKFAADCDVRMPDGAVEQKRIIEDLITQQVDGIAVSPIDAANQTDMINDACRQTTVITHDSDAPDTQRRCFIGIDNYVAGRMVGELIKEAMPDGGSVMLFVGRLEQDNAKKRRQGVIDELLGREPDPQRYDPPGNELAGDRYTVLDTRTDQFTRTRAKANAEDAIALHADLGCMVGLFAYNPPACLEALRGAGKIGEVLVVGFDEDESTLQGIIDGEVYGTIVQNPYRYGYESVRILAALARGDESALPEGGYLDVPARRVVKDNVREFWDQLKLTLSGQ